MAFCGSCGADAGGAAFCPKCGAPQGVAQGGAVAAPPPGSSAAAPATAGLEENVAGLVSYILGWVTGLIFLLIDKRPFVKFHAAQSIALNICFVPIWILYIILSFILTAITAALHFPIGILSFFLMPVIGLAFFVTWIFCMIKAYQHEKFKLPIIGNLVEKMIGQ